MARRQVLAAGGPGVYLIALSSPLTARTEGIVLREGVVVGMAQPVDAILARGYWIEWRGTPFEEQQILDLMPGQLPNEPTRDPQ